MVMTRWRTELSMAMESQGDSWDDVEGSTLTDGELDQEFNEGFGATEGVPFTLWTKKRVYFPWVYDGSEGVASVPRNPCNERTQHVGG